LVVTIETKLTMNSTCRWWKGYWDRFWEWGHNCKREAVGTFCTTIPLLILLWFLANCGGENQPPTLFTLPCILWHSSIP